MAQGIIEKHRAATGNEKNEPAAGDRKPLGYVAGDRAHGKVGAGGTACMQSGALRLEIQDAAEISHGFAQAVRQPDLGRPAELFLRQRDVGLPLSGVVLR